MNEIFDGWKLSRRLKVPTGPIRYYCSLIDADYTHHCITVSAHMSNLYNSFVVRQGQVAPNFFDLEKWTEKKKNE